MAINLLNNSEVAGTLTIRADGTSSPSDSNKLIFKGIGGFGDAITRGEIQVIDDDVNPDGSLMIFRTSDDSAALGTHMVIDAYGFVGIGTSDPVRNLDVATDVKVGTTLEIGSISNASSDTDKFLVSDSGIVKYRTGAQVRSDIGAGTGNGSVTSVAVTVGTGLDVSGSPITGSGTIDIDLDLSEFTATSTMVASDEFIVLDNNAERKIEASDIGLSIFNNDAGFTTNTGTVTSVGATAPVQSTGGTTPVISVDTAAVSSASSKLATGAQIQTAIESSVSGTANRVAKFTADHVVGNSEIVDTGSSITMGKDASAASTLYLDTDNRKVGFRTETPGSAFDVNGTIRVRNQLNVGHTTEQNLYVNGDGSAGGQYVKMGNYGSGNYFGITSSENQPKYCASFGNAGKIVEDMRIVTIKLSGNAFKLLKTTGTTLLAAPGANSLIIPYECIIHNSGGTSGNWNSSSSTTAAIGFCDNVTCTYPGQFNRLFVINNTLLNTNAAWYYAAGIATTGKAMALNKPLLLKASQDITTAPTGSWYIQIRYQVMNKDSGLVNNVDITKTTN